MGETGRRVRVRPGVAVMFLTLILLAQGCAGWGPAQGGSSGAGGGSVVVGAGSGGGAEMAVVEGGAGQAAGAEQGFDRRIVKTAELGVQAEDVRASVSEAGDVSERFGGEVLSSRVYGGGGPVSADLVITVPSGGFGGALDELRGLGRRITTDTVKGQDVSEEFVDLESRERNLLAAEKSLLTLYDRAEDVDDTLEVQEELTNVRDQVEQVQGRIQYLERRAAASRISLTIDPVSVAAAPQQNWEPALTASRAWDASLRVLQTGATAIISAAVFCWWLTPVAVVGLIAWRRHQTTRPADPS